MNALSLSNCEVDVGWPSASDLRLPKAASNLPAAHTRKRMRAVESSSMDIILFVECMY